MARVLITEKLAERGLKALADAGHEVDVRLDLDPKALLGAIVGANALIVRSATQVTAAVLEAGTDLAVVGRAGIGLDNVDVDAATRRGVMVVNAPESNVLSAAEHAMALLLAQARNVPQAHAALMAGKWERSKWEGVELHGKTLGVIGLGRIGALVAQRALAFGMRLCAYDPYVSPDRARHMGVEMLPLEELVAESDFLTIHLPKTAETAGLIGAELLAKAKARHPHRERGPGWHRRRGGTGRRAALGQGGRSRFRRLRHRAVHRLAALRVPNRGGHSPPGRVHRGGSRQSRCDDRGTGEPGVGGGLRALCSERRRHGGVRDSAALPPSGRTAGPVLRLPQRRPARATRGRIPGRPGRRQHLDPDAGGAQGHLLGRDRGAGVLCERTPAGFGTGPRGARSVDLHGARLRQPDHLAFTGSLHGRDAYRDRVQKHGSCSWTTTPSRCLPRSTC